MADTQPLVVVGLDLSLTATGIARVDQAVGETSCWTEGSKGRKDDSLRQRAERLSDLDSNIRHLIPFGAYVAVEGPSHGSTSGHHHDRSGLWWIVVSELTPYCKVFEVTPTQVKKYATGKGNASKAEVMIAAVKRYPQFDITNDNEADAVILAAFLARAVGQPIEESLPQTHLAALDKFSVPTRDGGEHDHRMGVECWCGHTTPRRAMLA